MPTRFHHTRIWKEITASARKQRGFVAAAYVGKAGYKLLPLRSGSVLVADFSEGAIKSGQTCPDAILDFIRQGVRVFSWQGLHAKVFCFGSKAFVGSTNVSSHSANILKEAVIETTDRATVRSIKDFVLTLIGDEVSELQAKQMRAIYRPPMFAGKRAGRKTKHRPQSVIWTIPLVHEDFEEEVERQDKASTPKARKRILNVRRFELDRFHWTGGSFVRRLELNQRVLMVTKHRNGTTWLSSLARVVYIRRFQVAGRQHALVYVELRRDAKEKNLKRAKQLLGRLGSRLSRLGHPRRLSDPTEIYSLSQLWHAAR